ncbi:hypothetical protein [Runella salmonicolor]|uniref:PBCV-specific basic adaptor domain-containing protein n=1 Tax=Runella salmonicolor TaxID=2950278 RepID=A0ABT1FX64_9BACT|nr:hypothetical protein [Runella salmonicolor]MCP1386363.1 hypothetical protein [Runella salmonicolor]
MNKILLPLLLTILVSITSFAQSLYNPYSTQRTIRSSSSINNPYGTNPNVKYQEGYQRSNGTYVQGHYKTESNATNIDNFSTQGNTNPYTLQSGTRAQDYSSEALNYGQGQTIQTGSRGGQYYVNENGRKTYVPKRSSNNPF